MRLLKCQVVLVSVCWMECNYRNCDDEKKTDEKSNALGDVIRTVKLKEK